MGLKSFFGIKKPQQTETPVQPPPDFDSIPVFEISEQKSFDWSYYHSQAMNDGNGYFQNEFNTLPTKRTIKNMYAREGFVYTVTQEISRQFMNADFYLERTTNSTGTEEQTVSSHPMIKLLQHPGDPGCIFHSGNITELLLTGDCILWFTPNKKKLIRIPTDKVDAVIENGKITEYRLYPSKGEDQLSDKAITRLSPDEIVHIKLPNPYSPFSGLSPFIAQVLHILIDKYGHEFIVSFFLRGGNTSGIIETQTNQINQLVRLMKSIMQAFGSRRNMHADKILPQNTKWVSSGQKFSDIGLESLIRGNTKRIAGAMGVPPVIYGDTDSVNYANADAQIKLFWENTILPLQQIYCAGLQYSPLGQYFGITENDKLYIDNANNEYLSKFSRSLDEDMKLKTILTINERRERLGFDPLPENDERGLLFESEVRPSSPTFDPFALDKSEVLGKSATPDEDEDFRESAEQNSTNTPKKMDVLLFKTFAEIEKLVLENPTPEGKAIVDSAISSMAEKFGKDFSEAVIDRVMRHYNLMLSSATKGTPPMRTKAKEDQEAILEDLQERARSFLAAEVAEKARGRFLGYTRTLTESVYRLINSLLSSPETNNATVEAAIRQRFGEYYEGQAQTIVRTEYGAALGLANQKIGSDLTTVSRRLAKKWLAVGDKVTRDTHVNINKMVLSGEANDVMEMSFSDNAILRFPNDPLAPPEETINCRCVLVYKVLDWR